MMVKIRILYLFILIGIILILIYLIIKKLKQKKRLFYYEKRYSKFVNIYEKENKKMKNIDIIFLGDSLIYRFNLKQFFPEFNSLNRGIGGDTTFGVEKRLNVSCFEVQSKCIVMLIGINNIDSMFENYESILIKFKEKINERKIILCSLTPLGGKKAIKNNLIVLNNEKIKNLAKKYNFIFIDLFTPLLNEKTNEIFEKYTKDGLHFTNEGYEVITKEIKTVLNKLF